jgi:small nuclear ribonucleoprotein (snRNP)-like protein
MAHINNINQNQKVYKPQILLKHYETTNEKDNERRKITKNVNSIRNKMEEKNKEDENSSWAGKRVYLVLKGNRYYTGVVQSFNNQFLIMIDKFGNKLMCDISQIASIEEEKVK